MILYMHGKNLAGLQRRLSWIDFLSLIYRSPFCPLCLCLHRSEKWAVLMGFLSAHSPGRLNSLYVTCCLFCYLKLALVPRLTSAGAELAATSCPFSRLSSAASYSVAQSSWKCDAVDKSWVLERFLCATLGWLLNLWVSIYFICKIGILILPTSVCGIYCSGRHL